MQLTNGKMVYNKIIVKKIDSYFQIEIDDKVLTSDKNNIIKTNNLIVSEKIIQEIESYKNNINLETMLYTKTAINIIDNMQLLNIEFACKKYIEKIKFDTILYLQNNEEKNRVYDKIFEHYNKNIEPMLFNFNKKYNVDFSINKSLNNSLHNEQQIIKLENYIKNLTIKEIYFKLLLSDILDSIIISDLLVMGAITVDESINASFVESICQMEIYGKDNYLEEQINKTKEKVYNIIEFL